MNECAHSKPDAKTLPPTASSDILQVIKTRRQMGYEYKITAALSPDSWEKILRAAGANFAMPVAGGYEYRMPGSTGVPSAFAKPEAYGLYLCTYERHGLGAEVLGYIVAAAAELGSALVEPLE